MCKVIIGIYGGSELYMKNRELRLFLKIALGVLLLGLLTIVLLSLFNGCTPKGWQAEVPARAAVLDAQPELVS